MGPVDGQLSNYHLRRIGPGGTCLTVQDIMRIKLGVTSFGRGDGCDFYLDSKVLKNFISRKHAEIHSVKNEDGQIDFVLHHKGLNGTFINDIKAPQTQLLAEGDKITFGHKNGYNLKPGQFASQPNSEFQYIFEKIKKDEVSEDEDEDDDGESDSNVEVPSDKSDENSDIEDTKIPTKNDLKDMTILRIDQKSPQKGPQKGPSKNKKDIKMSPTKTLNTEQSEKKSDVKKVQQRTYLGTNNSAMSRSRTSASSSSSSIAISSSDEEDEKSTLQRGNKENDRTKKVTPNKLKHGETINYGNSADRGSNRASQLSVSKDQSSKQETPTNNKNMKLNGTKRKLLSKNSTSKRSKQEEDDDDDNSSSSEDDDSNHDEDEVKDSDSDPYAFSNGNKSNNATTLKRNSNVGSLDKQRKSNLIGPPKRPLNVKTNKRKAPQKAVTNNRKGKKLKRGRSKKDDSDDDDDDGDDDLEDGVEWYEEEKCASSDCRKPKNKRLGWVQCDDCDNWYHTECVGCRYEHVKDTNIKFSCGCR